MCTWMIYNKRTGPTQDRKVPLPFIRVLNVCIHYILNILVLCIQLRVSVIALFTFDFLRQKARTRGSGEGETRKKPNGRDRSARIYARSLQALSNRGLFIRMCIYIFI